MKYITPADVGISDDRAAHIARGSAEPGTDYKTAYGTDLRMPADGVVSYVEYGNGAPGGRRVRITCGDEWIDLIHLSAVNARVGDRVAAGQTGVCRSGASGFGRDWYYGPHVHVTRRRIGAPYRDTLDFQTVAGNPSTAGKPAPTPIEHLLGSENDMIWIAKLGLAYYLIVPQGGGKPRAVQLGSDGYNPTEPYAKIPQISFDSDWSQNKLRQAVDGL